MGNNKGRSGGIGLYVMIGLLILFVYLAISKMGSGNNSYSYEQFLNDVDSGAVTSVVIRQNSEVPTGVLLVEKGDKNYAKTLYVSDVNDVQTLLRQEGISYTLKDVTKAEYMAYDDNSVWYMSVGYSFLCDDDKQAGGWR